MTTETKNLLHLLLPHLLEHEPYLRVLDGCAGGGDSFLEVRIDIFRPVFSVLHKNSRLYISYIAIEKRHHNNSYAIIYVYTGIVEFSWMGPPKDWLYKYRENFTLKDLYTHLHNYFGLDTTLFEIEVQLRLLEDPNFLQVNNNG